VDDQAWRHAGAAVQRLNLRLLIHTQDQRFVGGLQIQTDDVSHFLDKQRIFRELECLDAVGLQRERAPDPAHRRLAQPAPTGHGACAPMRGIARRVLERQPDDLLHVRERPPVPRSGRKVG
jgi:hypothetical protein